MGAEKEEGNKRARIVGKNPMSMRFCGFFTRATDLSTAKQEVKRIATRATSVVFLDSRRNETTRNGWINFANAKDCEDFIKEIVKNPPKNGLRFKKQGAHLKPEKKPFLHSSSQLSLRQQWMDNKFPLPGQDLNFDDPEKTRDMEFLKF